MIIDGYTAELLINRAIGGTTLEESVKALQDVFVDHDPAEKGEPMSDLISRQAAIERINKQREHLRPNLYPQDEIGDSAYRICAEFIERLPSAEPEIVRCKDCKYFSESNSFSGKCTLRGDFIFTNDYCSYAVERRTDEQTISD